MGVNWNNRQFVVSLKVDPSVYVEHDEEKRLVECNALLVTLASVTFVCLVTRLYMNLQAFHFLRHRGSFV